MNPNIRQRAKRNFLASLLQSNFSSREMLELAEELTFGNFAKELSDYIREWIHLSEIGEHRDAPGYNERPDTHASILSAALDTISRRRLSKKFVIQIMALASSWIKPSHFQTSGTAKEMIEKYLLTASPTEASKFLSILEGEPADAYLKGIVRRDRAK